VAAKKSKPKRATDASGRAAEIKKYLEQEVWPTIPKEVLGKRVTKREREKILGYGPHGV
jgi:antitoxin VapB